jgi:hypothetical protein
MLVDQKSRRPPDSILDARKKARVAADGSRAGYLHNLRFTFYMN